MKTKIIAKGNHENIFIVAKLYNVIKFKIVAFPKKHVAYVISYTMNKTVNPHIINYMDKRKIFDEINNSLKSLYDISLYTHHETIFTKRSVSEAKEFLNTVYSYHYPDKKMIEKYDIPINPFEFALNITEENINTIQNIANAVINDRTFANINISDNALDNIPSLFNAPKISVKDLYNLADIPVYDPKQEMNDQEF